jgi:F-type H+-transporting ATPase subunit a
MNALDPVKLAGHVKDAPAFELPFHHEVLLPKICGLQLTKFMVLELVAAVAMIVIFVPLGRKLARGRPPKGHLGNLFELMIVFVRDEMVRPAIGGHDADRFLPLILTLFFFILFCNLLGVLPWAGSPTASINVTAPLAVMTFLAGVGAGMKKYGPAGFWLGLCPHMELSPLMKAVLVPLILVLEIVGLLIKHCILAIRLLANMFGGHLVLAMIVAFIPAMAASLLWPGVTVLSVLGGTAISLLELLVAFLQAYIFAFLSALFIGMNVHQH